MKNGEKMLKDSKKRRKTKFTPSKTLHVMPSDDEGISPTRIKKLRAKQMQVKKLLDVDKSNSERTTCKDSESPTKTLQHQNKPIPKILTFTEENLPEDHSEKVSLQIPPLKQNQNTTDNHDHNHNHNHNNLLKNLLNKDIDKNKYSYFGNDSSPSSASIGPRLNKIESLKMKQLIKPSCHFTEEFDQCNDEEIQQIFQDGPKSKNSPNSVDLKK